jgi:aryl-alcohol dehydrogenase-like predicted oxidoreductase/predicted kinase
MAWLDPSELRVGLGCMRLPADEPVALATIDASLAAGLTVFDTARAYQGNEHLLGRALRGRRARIVTKGGMRRDGARWVADGRARTIRSDCEASLAALDGLPIDLYLIHAPDPRTPLRTSVRALAKLRDDGLVRHVGVANVSRAQLDEALELAPIDAVQVGLSVVDDRALRGGVVERCAERGIAVIAHSPLGGPRRVAAVLRNPTLAAIAAVRGATAAEVALAWVLGVSPSVIAIPGARRPETARSAARATSVALDEVEVEEVERALGLRRARAARTREEGEVVLVMGIPGAGKTRVAQDYAERGYFRLNRDERGGSLRELASALEEAVAGGARRVVLDNTYLTRAARSRPIEVAASAGLAVRCVWIDAPLAQAQINLVQRLLERHDALPSPEELRRLARSEQGVLAPTSQMRAARELEPPSVDEGFATIERIEFARAPGQSSRSGVLVAARALEQPGWENVLAHADPDAPHLVLDWSEGGSVDALAGAVEQVAGVVGGQVVAALCPHPGGPPTCWCRPPLPGLPLLFARTHGIDLARSTVIAHAAAYRTLATALGARHVELMSSA